VLVLLFVSVSCVGCIKNLNSQPTEERTLFTWGKAGEAPPDSFWQNEDWFLLTQDYFVDNFVKR